MRGQPLTGRASPAGWPEPTARGGREGPGARPTNAAKDVFREVPKVPILDNRHSISSLSFGKTSGNRILEPISQAEVFTNFCVKINPRNGNFVHAIAASRDIFKGLDVEALDKVERAASLHDGSGLERSARRAKAQLLEYANATEFDLFFTLTLAPEKIDRYDYKAAVKKFGQWADNRVRRRGLRYLAVPELHKDKAVHFHGLCNADACKLLDSRKRDRAGRKVWNLADWDVGFTTAVKLDGSREAVAHYISKYILKQFGGLGAGPQVGNGGEVSYRGTIGGRYYFHGGDLARYHVQHYRVSDFEGLPGSALEVEGFPGLRLKYITDATLLSELAEEGKLEPVGAGGML